MAKNKSLVINKVSIEISPNQYIDGGYYFGLKAEGIFPGCRKPQTLSFCPMAKRIWVKPLHGYSGVAYLTPADYLDLVALATIEVPSWERVTVTPELEQRAREHVASMATCPAINAECHPDYQPEYTPVTFA